MTELLQSIQDEQQKAKLILYHTKDLEWEAFDERDAELMTGRVNAERGSLHYYPAVRAYVEAQDHWFRRILPNQYNIMLSLFGDPSPKWEHVVELAVRVQETLGIGTPQKGGIVDCRVKSLFGIWEKMDRYKLEPNEVFDILGVRVTARDAQSARRMKEKIVTTFRLMEPHQFTHNPTKIHIPISDTLNKPNKFGFASIRITCLDETGDPFEIQVQTLKSYMRWRQREKDMYASLVASPKYGLLIEPE